MKNRRIPFVVIGIFLIIVIAGCLKKAPEPSPEPVFTPEPTPVATVEPTAVPAPEYEKARVVRSGARMREEPSKDSVIIRTFSMGDLVEVIEQQGDWFRVQDDEENQGYMFQNLIQILHPDNPQLPPVTEPETVFPDKVTYYVIKGANVRAGPGTQYEPPVSGLGAGAEFIVEGATGNWFLGTAGSISGWIYAKLLSAEPQSGVEEVAEPPRDEENLGPYDPFSEPGTESAEPEEHAVEPADQPQASPEAQQEAPPVEPQPDESVTPAESPVPEDKPAHALMTGKAQIIGNAPVKVREEPSPLAKVVEEVPEGEEVTILDAGQDWCRIQTVTAIGYVPSIHLSMVNP